MDGGEIVTDSANCYFFLH
uniref:Uncharacterized protein n=1 Tax=Rhizophora mucronata TaxID=61149 RepID=A0A2P2QEJ9_RHIMU